MLARLLGIWSKGPPAHTWEEAAPRLFPRLRDASYLDLATLRAGNRSYAPVARAVAPGLFVTLVVDDESSMTNVSAHMLTRWRKRFDAALARARQNLLSVSLDNFVELADGLWMAPWDDSYAASRLVLPQLLQRLTIDPLVAVPNRDTLLVARAGSKRAVNALTRAIENPSEPHDHPITNRLFRLREHALEPVALPAVWHHNMCVRELMQGYTYQQQLLQRHLGDKPYVASIDADEARDGRLVTRALWTRGVDTLLPKVDRVHLLHPEEREGEAISSRMWVVAWDDLVAMRAIAPTKHHLHRYRTGRFPNAEAIKRCAIPIERDHRTAELSV
ncbi:MAG TPA: hypothetical protein VFB62_02865 [Polyangiaceae bacterium]|jgi:hypothetical protein|nr:hypothetical protein [Polyangiaceae bacterium]